MEYGFLLLYFTLNTLWKDRTIKKKEKDSLCAFKRISQLTALLMGYPKDVALTFSTNREYTPHLFEG